MSRRVLRSIRCQNNVFTIFILICGIREISNHVTGGRSDEILPSDLASDAFLDSLGFLDRYGYPSERVSVTSKDGYISTLFRIPRRGPPVLLVHGITDSSDEWLVLGPDRSLAYRLSDAGFDIWLFNFRGNRYSRGHAMDITMQKYWDFSYEEMGTQDLPAVIDHILEVTSQEKLSYVGFSQGTTIFFVMCSMLPEYNNKIQVPILLAPVAWVDNLRMPIIQSAANNIDLFMLATTGIGLYDLFPFQYKKAFNSVSCHKKYSTTLCNLEYHFNFGLTNSSYMSPDRITVIDSHVPAGCSVKNLLHFIQGYKSKKFRRYDYGWQKNLEMYSSMMPPRYNIELVTVPVILIASESDWLSNPTDVKKLKKMLPNIKRFIMFNKSLEFSHLEFVYGTRVNDLINDPVINILLNDVLPGTDEIVDDPGTRRGFDRLPLNEPFVPLRT